MAIGGIISTGSNPKLLWPGIYTTWGQKYNEHMKEYEDLYEIKDSGKAYEEAVQITGFGMAPVKPQGASVQFDSSIQGWVTRYQHIAYALGFICTYEEIKDNLYAEVAPGRAEDNAFAMRQTVENVATFPYNNAFSNSLFSTADGQPLISASHLNSTGGTFSNALSPGADLSESALEDLCIQIMGVQTDRGLNIQINPLSLIVAKHEWFNANRILKSILQSNTSNNNINVLNATNAFPGGIKMNHYLTSPSAFFIRTNCPHGMTMFWRDRIDFTRDNDYDTRNEKASSYMRFSVSCTDPRGIFGSNGP